MARPATHKFQHARLEAQASLKPAELLAISDETAGQVTAVVFSGKRETWVHLGKHSSDRHEYWVGRYREDKQNKTSLRFVVHVEPADGQTSLSSSISFFRTQQSTFLGFIPAGPKQLIGYGYYKRFMINLEDAIRARDPKASIEILERA